MLKQIRKAHDKLRYIFRRIFSFSYQRGDIIRTTAPVTRISPQRTYVILGEAVHRGFSVQLLNQKSDYIAPRVSSRILKHHRRSYLSFFNRIYYLLKDGRAYITSIHERRIQNKLTKKLDKQTPAWKRIGGLRVKTPSNKDEAIVTFTPTHSGEDRDV